MTERFDIARWMGGIIASKGKGLFLLIDPDNSGDGTYAEAARSGEKAGVDAILVGGSLMIFGDVSRAVSEVENAVALPTLIFPGSARQICPEADGILFLSLLSGRNPRWLIEEQVEAAPVIEAFSLPSLPTAYLLIESGNSTSVAFISGTLPIPRDKPDIAAAHAIAAGLLGFRAIFLEAGSGARESVPPDMVACVKRRCSLPLIVGGGIRDPKTAKSITDAGADFIVVGTAFEKTGDVKMLKLIADAVHSR